LFSADLTTLEVIDASGQVTYTWKVPWTTGVTAVAADGRHLALLDGQNIYILRLPPAK